MNTIPRVQPRRYSLLREAYSSWPFLQIGGIDVREHVRVIPPSEGDEAVVMTNIFCTPLASPCAVSWSVVTEEAAWGPRGWFDVVSLSGLSDPYADVAAHSDSRHLGGGSPRLWLAGGGYMGQKGNSIVDKMVGYVDTWFSADGSNWYQVGGVRERRETRDKAISSAVLCVEPAPRERLSGGQRRLVFAHEYLL